MSHYDAKALDIFFTKMVLELINVKTSYISKLLLQILAKFIDDKMYIINSNKKSYKHRTEKEKLHLSNIR